MNEESQEKAALERKNNANVLEMTYKLKRELHKRTVWLTVKDIHDNFKLWKKIWVPKTLKVLIIAQISLPIVGPLFLAKLQLIAKEKAEEQAANENNNEEESE